MSDGQGCEPFAYVYGGITICPKPPPPFKIGVKVFISGNEAAVSNPVDGTGHVLLYYLAVVRPGLVKINCSAGNILVTKEIEAKPNQLNIVNFCFGIPVSASKETKVPETSCENMDVQYPLDKRDSSADKIV